MPLYAVPRGDNDGGYAVSDYRAINPNIGSMDDLARLTSALRDEQISLVLDFVFNHTSDEHAWAEKAKAGDPDFLAYYLTFPDRELPDQFQRYLRDIFPTVRKGSFTWCEKMNRFYTSEFPGSFARGMPFQFNADTGDLRISGTLSSLAGLEEALSRKDNDLIERAVRRVNLLRSIVMSIDGIPPLYIGDEWEMLNDYKYLSDPVKATDSRWVHRSRKRWEASEDLTDQETLEWRFFQEMVKLTNLRKNIPAFQNGGMEVISTGNPHLFGYIRALDDQKIMILNNFSDRSQKMDVTVLTKYGAKNEPVNLLRNEVIPIAGEFLIGEYQPVWLDIS
jgi:glycosidase